MRQTKLPKGLIKSHPQIKRPASSTYDPAIAEKILQQIAKGKTLNGICRQPGYPPPDTFVTWVRGDLDGLTKRYALARELQHDAMADDIQDIGDDQTLDPNSRRVMVDGRKWLLARISKRYRDNAALEVEQRTTTVQQVASVSDLRKLVRDHEAAMAAMDQDERDTGLVQ